MLQTFTMDKSKANYKFTVLNKSYIKTTNNSVLYFPYLENFIIFMYQNNIKLSERTISRLFSDDREGKFTLYDSSVGRLRKIVDDESYYATDYQMF